MPKHLQVSGTPTNGQVPTYSTSTSSASWATPSGGTALPADAAGWLHDNGTGTLAWTTPTKADVGLSSVTNDAQVPLAGGTMTGQLVLPANTTTLSPLKLQSGTLKTSPVGGEMEYDGNDLYFTTSLGRKALVGDTRTQTLTNKTMSGASNTFSNIPESAITNLTTDLAAKQATLTLTTTGTSGAATLVGSTLNIPQYSAGGGSGIVRSVSSISAPTTAGAAATTDYVYFVSGTTTLTLPTAVGNTNRYTVKNTGSATVTIATTSSQTIDGSTTASLPVANTAIDLISDGANWQVV